MIIIGRIVFYLCKCFSVRSISLKNYGLLAVFLVLPFVAPFSYAVKLEPLWINEDLRTPESVLFYHGVKESFLLVSEIEGDSTAADGEGGIAKLDIQGNTLNRDWVRGLNAPKGMAVYKDKLYVADIDHVVVINMNSQKIEAKIKVADAVFLNDVTVDNKGVVYVSDTRTNKVHKIVDDQVEVYQDNIKDANGLLTIGSNLVVGAGPVLWLADNKKHLLKIAEGFESNIDGIELVKPGEFIVSCWVGLIYYVYIDGRIEKLIDSREQQINTADLVFDVKNKILYVPNFLKNSVTAYQLL